MIKKNHSKPIRKADDDAKYLIMECLGNEHTGGFDLDSIYKHKEGYMVLEFLKCDTVKPLHSHPSRYWSKNSQKFLSLWEITQKLEGRLILINYEDSREQFKVIEVLDMNSKGIIKEYTVNCGFQKFKKWFININRRSLGIKEL